MGGSEVKGEGGGGVMDDGREAWWRVGSYV